MIMQCINYTLDKTMYEVSRSYFFKSKPFYQDIFPLYYISVIYHAYHNIIKYMPKDMSKPYEY